jgi:hypothetical protein
MHTEAVHVALNEQDFPHTPQLAASLVRSLQP